LVLTIYISLFNPNMSLFYKQPQLFEQKKMVI